MDKLIIEGGKKLFGCISVPAAKNSVLPILAASIMLDGKTEISDCPKLSDIDVSMDIIRSVGAVAVQEAGDIIVTSAREFKSEVSEDLCRKMRSSVLYIAPLIYRCKQAHIYLPGGCCIGQRPIDIHLEGLKALGAEIAFEKDKISITAPNGLTGTIFKLKVPSVGATQTLMMAACTAKGVTVLKNCAKEPEVADLACFLKRAGAKIMGVGTEKLIITGVESLCAVQYTPMPDRIFAATALSAVTACKGVAIIKNYPKKQMNLFEKTLSKAKLKVFHCKNTAFAISFGRQRADIEVETFYYPGFSTDMGPVLAAALVNNQGRFTLKENIFENRFSYMEGFKQLGLNCDLHENVYSQTVGIDFINQERVLKAKDLRAGAALVVAAMATKGKKHILGVEYIDRGYEKIDKTFKNLGANVKRVKCFKD